ncbi:hypothetical protein V9T40_006997 [Parthenolecanium corni]|uniref:Gag protein n=1 Tax=Parthenolecanium corni TaxID=536013 RepID=A0AAN9TTR3_9HEMI
MARTKDDIARDKRFHTRNILKQIEDVATIISETTTKDSCNQLKLLQKQLKESAELLSEVVKEEIKAVVATTAKTVDQLEDELFDTLYATTSRCRRYIARAETVIFDFSQKKNRESLAAPQDLNDTLGDAAGPSRNDMFLEKLKLHEFDGDHRTFLKFKTLFQSAIHEHPTLLKVRKLYYLQMYLKGEAAALVEDLPCTEESYDEAWSLINSRYDNKKTIAMLHFQDLFAIPNVIKEDNLRSSLDQVTRALKALKLCGEEPGNWESIIAYIVYSRLIDRIKADSDVIHKNKQKFFTWKELNLFLDQRAVNNEARKIIEQHSDRRKNTEPIREQNQQPFNHKRSFAVGRTDYVKPECVACNKRHLMVDCATFKSKKPEERFELIKKAALCANCFRPGHQARFCKSNLTCKVCSRKHHTLLHPEYTPRTSMMTSATQEEPSKQETLVENQQSLYTHLVAHKKTILLPSAVVRIQNGKVETTARLLMDSCS